MGIKINSNKGFTIVEISLFLAISTLLLAGLMTGITITVQQQRFTDSLNATQSFLQQQFNETQYTLNNRPIDNCTNGELGGADPATNPGGSSCMVVGKFIDLGGAVTPGDDESQIVISNIISNVQLPVNYKNRTDFPSLRDLIGAPQLETKMVDNENRQTFTVPWGAQFTKIVEGDNPAIALDSRYLALIKSPITGTTSVYKVEGIMDIAASSYSLSDSGSTQVLQDFVPIHACVTSQEGDRMQGVLTISGIGSQDSISIEVDGPEGYEKWC